MENRNFMMADEVWHMMAYYHFMMADDGKLSFYDGG